MTISHRTHIYIYIYACVYVYPTEFYIVSLRGRNSFKNNDEIYAILILFHACKKRAKLVGKFKYDEPTNVDRRKKK